MGIRNYIFIFLSSGFLFGCSNFSGIAGNTNTTYTADYNYPSLKTVPYDNPEPIENRNSLRKKVKVCAGVADSTGFRCSSK